MCETRWQNGKDLTWSGCSGEQGMPAEATECNQTTTKCKNHGKQNMRCYCTSESCNSKATYPQSCDIFVTGAAGAASKDGFSITVLSLLAVWTLGF